MLRVDDFLVLNGPFAQELEGLLPLPATVVFQGTTASSALFGDEAAGSSDRAPSEGGPRIEGGKIVIPILCPEERIDAVITDIDPALAQMMSPGWLRELQARCTARLTTLRLTYTDPDTDFYNRRALDAFLCSGCSQEPWFIFLFQALHPRRTVAATLQQHKETADYVRAITSGILFSFGFGVFGLLRKLERRDLVLQAAHQLQHQLKREGLRKVPVTFASLAVAGGALCDFERLCQALAVAEQRGPFGICDARAEEDLHGHPFRFFQPLVYDQLKKWSKGCLQFSIAVLCHGHKPEDDRFDRVVTEWLRQRNSGFFRQDNYAVLFFPDEQAAAVAPLVEALSARGRDEFGQETLSAGIAEWPCLDFRRSEVLGNCLKALLHGSFLGKGAVVSFDHLSLNISGDYFFEEGDYRAAVREYRRGLQLMASDINLLNSLGVALVACNLRQEAARCFEQALALDPANYMALINLGNLFQAMGRKTEALEKFALGFSARQDSETAGQELYLPLAKLYLHLGMPRQALVVLEEWRTRPGSERELGLYRLLGQAHMETDNLEMAMQCCQRALQRFPQDGISMSILGLVYVEGGQGEETGLALCRKALTMDGSHPDHWYRFGRALCHSGRLDEAWVAVKRCLKLDRRHGDALLVLGRICLLQGRTNQARKRFEQVLALKECGERTRAEVNSRLARLDVVDEDSR